ncbi:MAG: hypothetical protein ACREF8_00275, partial [Chthoniobacterales bacterium]
MPHSGVVMPLLVDAGKNPVCHFDRRVEVDRAIEMLDCAVVLPNRGQAGGEIRLIARGIGLYRYNALKYAERIPIHAFS